MYPVRRRAPVRDVMVNLDLGRGSSNVGPRHCGSLYSCGAPFEFQMSQCQRQAPSEPCFQITT